MALIERSGTIRLTGIGSYLPAARASNLSRLAEFEIGEDFLRRKIGVLDRAVKSPQERTSDLCVEAFKELARNSPVDPDIVQLVCVVTQNPDTRIPHTAAIVHHKLGLAKHCMTFDVSQGCAGYTHGLPLVAAFMEKFGLRHALLFTCDPYSNIVDPQDKNTALLFGDAATATYLTTNGSGYRLVDASFGTAPGTTECLWHQEHLVMNGQAVFMNAAREVPENIDALLAQVGLDKSDVDLFLLHPGSAYLINTLRRKLGVPAERLPFDIAEYGNTVSSSIPLMLEHELARKSHRNVVLSGFGVGFSWGSCLLELIN
jgi:3-oxoacyl-[acyl-carrier-protein] synthase-3